MTFLKPIFATLAAIVIPAFAQQLPITIEHKFGTTVIESKPERVATVDYAGADNLLALGIQPLTVRSWYGPYENGLWPWAQALSQKDPELLSGQLNFEQIAATNPDVIVAIRSGITEQEYARLSTIAPVVAVPAGWGDYDLNWEEQAMLAGRALGREADAIAQIEALNNRIENVAASHPEWEGKTFVMLTVYNGDLGLYTQTDSSVKTIEALGLEVHPRVRELSEEGQFYMTISQEIMPELDADVVFWWVSAENASEIENLSSRTALNANAEGREIMLDGNGIASGALAHGSLISLNAAIDVLVPMIEAAVDGNPETVVAD
ncbi:MAG TPA: ABC transporter substrate-binding protein [Saccharospirillum sp.]|nr:ABC transporter substrate-binding protein [Saccharospirillum sp.]